MKWYFSFELISANHMDNMSIDSYINHSNKRALWPHVSLTLPIYFYWVRVCFIVRLNLRHIKCPLFKMNWRVVSLIVPRDITFLNLVVTRVKKKKINRKKVPFFHHDLKNHNDNNNVLFIFLFKVYCHLKMSFDRFKNTYRQVFSSREAQHWSLHNQWQSSKARKLISTS